MAPAIRASKLSKQYAIRSTRSHDTLRDLIVSKLRRPLARTPSTRVIWALKNISFEVSPGEVVGIVGRNGAGKSTLLKILSRITVPTSGRAEIRGDVGSLLEVGTGFHPELSGRENIFLNGAILGMSRAEIRRKFDDIVAFAQVERFIDTPIKRYSSGMFVRLAFSVAAHFEPDILLVDEVLSVGDQEFQRRSTGRMHEIAEEGRTVLFVSHNLAAVSALCPRSILLERGSVVLDGETRDVLEQYASSIQGLAAVPLADRQDRRGNGRLRFTSISVEGPRGPVRIGDPVTITLGYRAEEWCRGVEASIAVKGPLGEPLLLCHSRASGKSFGIVQGDGLLTCSLPVLPLLPAVYTVNIFANSGGAVGDGGEILDWLQDAATFEVLESDHLGHGYLPPTSHGYIAVQQTWDSTPPADHAVSPPVTMGGR